MKLRMIKRLTAALLCVVLLVGIPALAVFEDDVLPAIPAAPEVDAVVELPEWRAETPLISEKLDEQAQFMSTAEFSVTVPTTLPIHMDSNGGITCGDIVITNNGTGSVEVEDAQIVALNDWTLVDYPTTTFTDANKGQHKVALQLGLLDSAISANGGQKTIDVAAKIPYQGTKGTYTDIAQVVLVLRVLAPEASADWEYTTDGDTITLTKYIGESYDVVVHNKYMVDGKLYDKVALGESAYMAGPRIGPFAGSDKYDRLTSVTFEDGIILPENAGYMFYGCSSLTSLSGMGDWNTSSITNMSSMFASCSSLISLDVANWDISSVTNLSWMFCDCRSANWSDLSSWDTSNVMDMTGVFSGCLNRTSLDDLSDWDTSKVMDMSYMFQNCAALISLDSIGDWDTSNVLGMYYTFDGCTSLTNLDLTGWDLTQLDNRVNMFRDCSKLTTIYVKDQTTKDKLETSTNKPTGCKIIVAGIEITGGTTVNVYNAINLSVTKNLPPRAAEKTVTWTTSNADIATVSNSGRVWGAKRGNVTITAECGHYSATCDITVQEEGITDDGDWECYVSSDTVTLTRYIGTNTSVVVHNQYSVQGEQYNKVALDQSYLVTGPFLGSSNREKITSITFEKGIVLPQNMKSMFSNCSALSSIKGLSSLDATHVTDMHRMFYGCTSLTSISGLEGWDVSSVEDVNWMFADCTSLTSISGLSNWRTSSIKDMSNMFYNCSKLTNISGLSNWDTGSVTNMNSLFLRCSALANINALANWNTGSVTNMVGMFDDCSSITSTTALSGWNMESVTNIGQMFLDCTRLSNLSGLTNWNPISLKTMVSMFYGCTSITSLDLSNWSRLSEWPPPDMSYAFEECTKLKTVYVQTEEAKEWLTGQAYAPSTCTIIVRSPTRTASLDELSSLAPANTDATPIPVPEPSPVQVPSPELEPSPEPSQYELTISGPATVEVGYTVTLDITKTPEDAAAINWTSSDETIATVDKFGVVTGIGAGEVIISAQADETICQWVMTVIVIPDTTANPEYQTEDVTLVLARHVKEFSSGFSCGPYRHYNIKI